MMPLYLPVSDSGRAMIQSMDTVFHVVNGIGNGRISEGGRTVVVCLIPLATITAFHMVCYLAIHLWPVKLVL